MKYDLRTCDTITDQMINTWRKLAVISFVNSSGYFKCLKNALTVYNKHGWFLLHPHYLNLTNHHKTSRESAKKL